MAQAKTKIRDGCLLRWGFGLATVLVLSGCGSSGPKPGQWVFPAVNAGYGYSSQGSMGGGVGQDPAETAAINPFDPIALNNLAVTEAARGRYQQASSLLQRAVKLAPARADIAANLANLQRWLAQVEGQAALGMQPQPLQLPYQETGVPEVPSLWVAPSVLSQPGGRGLPAVPSGNR
ncbi:MAG: hypothetical protein RJA09_2405 [Pseudomonadota bacterium]